MRLSPLSHGLPPAGWMDAFRLSAAEGCFSFGVLRSSGCCECGDHVWGGDCFVLSQYLTDIGFI